MRKPKLLYELSFVVGIFLLATRGGAQSTFPENGVADPRHNYYAFTNASIVKDAATTLTNATMVIKDGKIVAVGNNLKLPAGAVVVDCKGKFIYPSFIDIYADYGTAAPQRTAGGCTPGQQPQLATAAKGPYGWNQAIKSDAEAYKVLVVDDSKAKPLRDAGFGTVLSHVRDGIARGRNLAFNAGTAAAYGLTKEEALQAISLNAAKILGVADKTGSIEVGKDANIVISEGDILDTRSSVVTDAFIQGRKIDLNDKHKQLNERYIQKYNIKKPF